MLAGDRENKYTLSLRVEISRLYINICVKYTHIKLDGLKNDL
jgi:hypothetical protein